MGYPLAARLDPAPLMRLDRGYGLGGLAIARLKRVPCSLWRSEAGEGGGAAVELVELERRRKRRLAIAVDQGIGLLVVEHGARRVGPVLARAHGASEEVA